MSGKIILIDQAIFTHRSINDWGARLLRRQSGVETFLPPVSYIYFDMLISKLKRIGVERDDTIIVAMEGFKSWRKDICADYKDHRAKIRDEQKHINWPEKYNEINKFNEQLDVSTPFHFVRVNRAEADDVIAVACKHFSKEKECIIVSGDKDLEQLAYYPKVKVFSLFTKYKGVGGAYKQVKNPLKIIADKVAKGDVGDNILVGENDTEDDKKLRNELVNLLVLPNDIETRVMEAIKDLQPKTNYTLSKLPFPNSLARKFDDIYNPQFKINIEEVFGYQDRKIQRKKKADAKKRELKKKDKVILR